MNLLVNPGLANIGDTVILGGVESIVYQKGSRSPNVRYLKSRTENKFFYFEFDNHSEITKVLNADNSIRQQQ